jgi:hypothetical protein
VQRGSSFPKNFPKRRTPDILKEEFGSFIALGIWYCILFPSLVVMVRDIVLT